MLNANDFSVQIRRAVENLHDFAFLEQLPIVQAMASPDRTVEQSVRRLRSELLDIIERLKPPNDIAARSKGRRPYDLLYGRYVQCMTTEELTEELAISVRQLRREQKRALATLVALARERLEDVLGTKPPPDVRSGQRDGVRLTAADKEVAQLIQHATIEQIWLPDLIRTIRPLLDALAEKHSATVHYVLPEQLPFIYADRIVVRQALLGLLSIALDHMQGGALTIAGLTSGEGDKVMVEITAPDAQIASSRAGIGQAVSEKLLHSSGAQLRIEESAGQWSAQIVFPTAEHANILIVDDNVGLIQLFRRYLAGHPRYQVFEASTGKEIIDHANLHPLHLIILDVMMPGQDGWELLQMVRNEPATATVPVVVCSVLNEPQIALALGASDCLIKPVTQDALLEKVQEWCNAPLAPVAGQPPGRSRNEDFQ
jgi:CheY-like chemotaxis protein